MKASKLMFAGDPHGNFKSIIRDALQIKPDALITLGDHDLERPLIEELSEVLDAGVRVYWIPGNHDGDMELWYCNLFCGPSGLWNLHGRVININGIRVAGLGGVFREKVWFPGQGEPKFRKRSHMLFATPNKGHQGKWRAPGELEPGLPMKHRVTIFPEDVERLSRRVADVLVCHEAPTSHKYGFSVIDELARSLGVKLIVHGHHHCNYAGSVGNEIQVNGVGLAETYLHEFMG